MVKPFVAKDILMKVFHKNKQGFEDPDSDLDNDIPT